MLAYSLIGIVGNGAALNMVQCTGRGDKEGVNRYYSMIFTIMSGLAILFVIISFVFAKPLVILFGASQPDVVEMSTVYLRSYSLCIFFGGMTLVLNAVLRTNGLNKETVIQMIMQFILNVAFSFILLKKTSLGFASLGIGTVMAQGISLFYILIVLKKNVKGYHIKIYHYSREEYRKVMAHGLPGTSNTLVDSVAAGIVNNIIGITLGMQFLALYTIVQNIFNMASWATGGMNQSASPLYGLSYSSKDKNGLTKIFHTNTLFGLLFTAVWCVILILCMPILMTFFGVYKNGDIDPMSVKMGVYIMMCFLPMEFISQQITFFFESAEQFKKSLLQAVMPDSVIYPILIWIIAVTWGKAYIWFAYGLSYICYFSLYYIFVSVKRKRSVKKLEHFLELNEELMENVPKLDISIRSDDDHIVGLSERVKTFLDQEKVSEKEAYLTALCIEEMAVDMTSHAQKTNQDLDIKMFVEEEEISVVIRNSDKRYNPLDFDLNLEDFSKIGVAMIQKMARNIQYQYMYKMNVVTIQI